jgi:hypothetical protein
MIRVTCASCDVTLKAKDELAGQTRKCPKCGATVQIPEVAPDAEEAAAAAEADDWAGLDEVAPDQHVHAALDHLLPKVERPERLTRLNRYLICDKAHLFATWESNGQGWMLKTNAGFVKASRNADQLPSQGDYTLVEMVMGMTDDGLRLQGIHCYELAKRWALTTLEQDDHKILSRITGPGHLTKEQKSVVQKFLREQFMRDVWQDAREVLDYLANLDYHSPGAE